MTKESAQMALLLFDALLTATDHIADKIKEAREKGLLTIEEQQARELSVEAIRGKVGLPLASIPTASAPEDTSVGESAGAPETPPS